jgi:hypothetical protein
MVEWDQEWDQFLNRQRGPEEASEKKGVIRGPGILAQSLNLLLGDSTRHLST